MCHRDVGTRQEPTGNLCGNGPRANKLPSLPSHPPPQRCKPPVPPGSSCSACVTSSRCTSLADQPCHQEDQRWWHLHLCEPQWQSGHRGHMHVRLQRVHGNGLWAQG